MASNSYPRPGYNSGAVTDVEYEKLASQYSLDGLVGTTSDPALVYGDSSGRQVKVRASRYGLVRGRVYSSGATDITLTIGANSSGSTRVDVVVLRLDRSTSAVTEAVVAGTPGAGVPAVTQSTGTSGTYEIPLAQVTVANGASTIAATDVTPLAWYVTPSGTVVCTSTTRPTGVPRTTGMRIRETDTGRTLEWTGAAWLVRSEDSGALAVTLSAGWDASNSYLTRVSAMATVQLSVQRSGGNLPSGTYQIATIPSGSRPRATIEAPLTVINTGSGAYPAHVQYLADGRVLAVLYSGINNTGYLVIAPATYPVA